MRYFIKCRFCKERFVQEGEYADIGWSHGCEEHLRRLNRYANWCMNLETGKIAERIRYDGLNPAAIAHLDIHPLKGVKSEHKCDGRCINAKGHNCECECGGLNHGIGCVA